MTKTIKNKLSLGVLQIWLALAACSKTEQITHDTPSTDVYLSHQDGPITILSTKDFSKKGEIPVGRPQSIAELSADGSLLLATDVAKNPTLALIWLTTPNRITHKIQIGVPARLIRIHNKEAVVLHENPSPLQAKNQLTRIDLSTGLTLKTISIPEQIRDLAFSSNGELVLMSLADSQEISAYNLQTGQQLKTIDLSEYGSKIGKIKLAPDGKHLGALMEYGNKLLMLDHDLRVIGETPTGEVPIDFAYAPDNSEIFVLLDRGKTIQVFDAQTLVLAREIPLEEHCKHIHLTAQAQPQLLVTCPRSKNLYVFNPSQNTPTHTIKDAYTPWNIMSTAPTAPLISP
jgi:DNA-binding beta-propeller fold protein YncE